MDDAVVAVLAKEPVPIAQLLVMAALVGLFVYILEWNKDRPSKAAPSTGPLYDVGVLRFALDGRTRNFVIPALARIAQMNRETTAGHVAMLRELALLLRQLRDAWVFGGASNEPMRDYAGGLIKFRAHKEQTLELLSTPASDVAPARLRRTLAEDVIFVSFVVAASTELPEVQHVGSGEDLRKALETLGQRPVDDFVGIELLWYPSDLTARFSVHEVERRFAPPFMFALTNALAGMTFCACGWPYPAELRSCPRCSARPSA